MAGSVRLYPLLPTAFTGFLFFPLAILEHLTHHFLLIAIPVSPPLPPCSCVACIHVDACLPGLDSVVQLMG